METSFGNIAVAGLREAGSPRSQQGQEDWVSSFQLEGPPGAFQASRAQSWYALESPGQLVKKLIPQLHP